MVPVFVLLLTVLGAAPVDSALFPNLVGPVLYTEDAVREYVLLRERCIRAVRVGRDVPNERLGVVDSHAISPDTVFQPHIPEVRVQRMIRVER